jgi:hypothetical protein
VVAEHFLGVLEALADWLVVSELLVEQLLGLVEPPAWLVVLEGLELLSKL